MLGLLNKNHRIEMERLQIGCHASGAPDFMWDFLKTLSVKTGFNISAGAATMIQPFISGMISRDDAMSISEATGYLLDMRGVSTTDHYRNAISHLYEKLK